LFAGGACSVRSHAVWAAGVQAEMKAAVAAKDKTLGLRDKTIADLEVRLAGRRGAGRAW
jgi:hypothetical protein